MDRDALHHATAAEVRAGRRRARWEWLARLWRRWRKRAARTRAWAGRQWVRWVAFWKRRAHELAIAAKVTASVAAIAGSIVAGIKAVGLMRARDVGPADQQVGGSERMAGDRVDKPGK